MENIADHDQRFKALIREFFADFLRLFFADWARRFDLTTIEWLDSELLPDPPDGNRHQLDLVAKLRALEPIEPDLADSDLWLAVVHIEIESPDRTTRLKPRLPAYYLHLGERYGLPVLPIVLYLNVALDGIGIDAVTRRFWELEVLRLQYLYVGLPGLNGEDYVTGENWLGVALSALMQLPPGRAGELGLEALRRIQKADLTEQQQFLLGECVEAYLPVPDAELDRICGILEAEKPSRRLTMQRQRNKTTFDKALERNRAEGLQEGREEGQRMGQVTLIIALLESKFGSVPGDLAERLQNRSADELRQLALSISGAASLADLGL